MFRGNTVPPASGLKSRAKQGLLLMVSCFAYSSTLKIEVICFSEMLGVSELHRVTTQKTLFFIS
jgi:hypothetical protein